jgi:hypothetical protein
MPLKISASIFRTIILAIKNIPFLKFLEIFFLLILMLIIWKCVGNPLSSDINMSFTPLNVGDVRQIIYYADSSTTLFSIVGKTRRSDGTEVFVEETKYGTQQALFTSYYLIKDGYFVATELDTTDRDDIDKNINPFAEQRLAKSYPEDGDTWKHTLGQIDSPFLISKSIGQLHTFCGTFDNVFGFSLSDLLTTFYAKGIGWIGTSTAFSDVMVDFSCSYIRVDGKVFGHLWPEKDITIIPIDKQRSLNTIIAQYPFLIDQRFQINGEMFK